MIVRATDDTAELVMQVDHAVISGQLAEAWGGDSAAALDPRDSVLLAAHLHDIGWRHWEAMPRINADTGRPANFLDVLIEEHLRLYRLGIQEVEDLDPYAGFFNDTATTEIYTGRYGTQPALKLTRAADAQALVDAFVSEQEARYGALQTELDVSVDDLWRNYLLLQVFDRLSLRVCQGDPAGPGPMEIVLPDDATLQIVRADDGAEELSPWPFAVDELTVSVPTRTIALTGYADDAALATAIAHAPVEQRTTTLRPAN